MSFDEYLAKLDAKTAREIRTASEVELVKYPLASIGLTAALGGGIGAGRAMLLYGNTSSGKSVLCQQSIGIWQQMGLTCVYVDAEGTYEKGWAARLGVDNDKLIYISSKSSGRVEKEIAPHIKAGVDIIVIDSISDILPEVFIDSKTGEMADQEGRKQMMSHAKAITNLLNGIHFINDRTAVILISQTTTEVNQTYVKQIPHGGQKTQFGCSQIVRLRSSNSDNQQIKGEVKVGEAFITTGVGRKVEYYVEKNKLAAQSRSGLYDLYYDGDFVGIDSTGEIVDLAEMYGLVKKAGAWYNYADKQYQGRNKFISALNNDLDMKDELSSKVLGIATDSNEV